MSSPKYLVLLLSLVSSLALSTCAEIPPQTEPPTTAVETQQVKLAAINPPTWSAKFNASQIRMRMMESQLVPLTINYIDRSWGDDYELHVLAEDTSLLRIEHVILAEQVPKRATSWSGNFTVEALFIGHTEIYVELRRPNEEPERSKESAAVIVARKESVLDIIFRVSVAALVMLLYVSFGAAVDLQALKEIVLRPVGPVIGFFGQFFIMPVLSFVIGYMMFHDNIELRLGLFFLGCSPGGGSSNLFTVILNGNLNLSITMTAISNLAAFAMMPIWIFTLGALIFHDGNFAIPYFEIAMMSCTLVLPLVIGIALQKIFPKQAVQVTRFLKPVSLAILLFIMVFSGIVNSYIFRLFTWEIIIAGSALSWMGYVLAWTMAITLRQSFRDALTIAIETGIQNIGVAIFMLNFTLPQPQADMTTVVPVANSFVTPLPLLVLFLFRKCFVRTSIEEVEDAPTKEAKIMEVETIMEKGLVNPVAVINEQK